MQASRRQLRRIKSRKLLRVLRAEHVDLKTLVRLHVSPWMPERDSVIFKAEVYCEIPMFALQIDRSELRGLLEQEFCKADWDIKDPNETLRPRRLGGYL